LRHESSRNPVGSFSRFCWRIRELHNLFPGGLAYFPHIADVISANFRAAVNPGMRSPGRPEQLEYLMLKGGERGLEGLHGAPGMAQHVALGVAEEPQQLLSGWPSAAALLGI
jgi:hypothetical protein